MKMINVIFAATPMMFINLLLNNALLMTHINQHLKENGLIQGSACRKEKEDEIYCDYLHKSKKRLGADSPTRS